MTLFGQRKLCVLPSRTATGRRNATFWTADPYYRLHPEVANPGALSARLLENPTEGPNFSDISSILFAVQIECSRR